MTPKEFLDFFNKSCGTTYRIDLHKDDAANIFMVLHDPSFERKKSPLMRAAYAEENKEEKIWECIAAMLSVINRKAVKWNSMQSYLLEQ